MISRLQARLDLQVVLTPRGEGQQDIVRITHIAPYDATWVRHLPAVADELDVSFAASFLPVDLRAIESVRVDFWLFEHQDPSRCKRGDPGSFYGFSDEVGRKRTERTLTLSCRDWTAALLDAKVTPDDLKGINLKTLGSLEEVVKKLISMGGAFAATWKVRSLSSSGARTVYSALANLNVVKRAKGKGKGKTPAQVTQRRQLTLEAFASGDETSIWDIVCQLCARMGVVPEVSISGDVPEVVLVDALDLQTSDVLRPFSRGGWAGRRLTLGRTVATYDESLRLTRDADLPDQVVVAAWDHEKGTMVEVAVPKTLTGKRGDKPKRLFQVAEGSSDLAVLEKIATAAWAATRQHQLEVEVETWSPWSDGGGPHDPDLLDVGAGAALALEVDHGYAHTLSREERDAFERLPSQVKSAFTQAEARLPLRLLFQVAEVTHSYAAGDSPDYSCRLKLNAFLGQQPEGKGA